jgi:hypothetical protein
MAVLPFDPDPRPVAVALLLFITAAALAIGLLLRRVVDRFCDEDDPRRFYIAQGCSIVERSS